MANIQHNITVTANTSQAKTSLQDLQSQLQSLTSVPVGIDATGLQSAKTAIVELGQNLRTAMNPNTGKLDLSVFSRALKDSNKTILDYKNALFSMGTQGQQAFLSLSNAIASAEAPTNRLNQKILNFGKTLKNTINWQISSSLVHGVVGQVQQAISYAEKLNQSLNNIQIVTGQNNEKMAEFAKQANQTARQLSTSTTEYTNASLIYYQQGLNDKEVAARTETTLKLANVTRQSAQTVSDQLTAIWNNYAEGSSNLEHYADVITALGAATASSSAEIAGGLEKFAAISKTVGLSYDYATTALATIVATTRQSEDTVGTGLRTLFSRLEGLSLGETLEDGVNLNKYSSALAKVGVNIMDQYGKIKDMDNILDELGAKWGTISKEQQIALAQTVGGVRQYTNLIALMDNWDKFQSNLQVAQSADGTLQTQAERYATSWEAARKRVKTSAEGIYDSLIDDQGIIKVTNVFAGFLDVINGLVAGFGGLKGIIPIVGSLLLNSFAKNMPQFLNDIGNNFRVLTGQAQKDMTGMQGVLGATLTTIRDNTADPVYRAQLQKTIDTNYMNRSLAMNANRMSEADKAAYRIKIAQQEAMNDALIMSEEQRLKNNQAYEKITAAMPLQKLKPTKEDLSLLRRGNKPEQYQDQIQQALDNDKQLKLMKTSGRGLLQANFDASSNAIQRREQQVQQLTAKINGKALSYNTLRKQLENPEYVRKISEDQLNTERARLKNAKKALDEDTVYQGYLKQRNTLQDEINEHSKTQATTSKKIMELDTNIAAREKEISTKALEEAVTKEQNDALNQLLTKSGQQENIPKNIRQELNGQAIIADNIRKNRENGILTSFDQDAIRIANQAYAAPLRDLGIQKGKYTAAQGRIEAFQREFQDMFTVNDKNEKVLDTAAYTQKAREFVDNWNQAITTSGLDESLRLDAKNLLPDDGNITEAVNDTVAKISQAIQTQSGEGSALATNESTIRALMERGGFSQSQMDAIFNNGQQLGNVDFSRNLLPRSQQNPEEAQSNQMLSTTLTQAASAGMSLYSAFNAASNAAEQFAEESSTGLNKFGAAISTITSTLMSMGMAGNAVKSIFGKDSAIGQASGWIGLAIGLTTSLIGVMKGVEEARQKAIDTTLSETVDSGNESIERLTTSADLKNSQENLINAYNKTAADLEKGQSTQSALMAAQNELITALQEVTEGYSNKSAIAAVLKGDTKTAQRILDDNRLAQIEAEERNIENGRIAAGRQLSRAYSTAGINPQDIYSAELAGSGSIKLNEIFSKYIGQGAIKNVAENIVNTITMEDEGGNTFTLGSSETAGVVTLENMRQATAEQIYQYVKSLKEIYEEIQSAGLEGTQQAQNIKKQIDAYTEAFDNYEKFQESITSYGIEKLILGGVSSTGTRVGRANEAITNIEDYATYREQLITAVMEANKDALDAGQVTQDELITSIDAALGMTAAVTDNEIGNLQYIYQGIEGVIEYQQKLRQQRGQNQITDDEQKQMRNNLAQLYADYGQAVFDLGLVVTIPTTVAQDTSDFQSYLNMLQAIADNNKIDVQLNLASNFNLSDSSSMAEWTDFIHQLDEDLWEEITGTNFDTASFTALTSEEQTALLNQYTAGLNRRKYGANGTVNTTIQAYQNRLDILKGAGENSVSEAENIANRARTFLYGAAQLYNQQRYNSSTIAEDTYDFLDIYGDQVKQYLDSDNGLSGKERANFQEKIDAAGLTDIISPENTKALINYIDAWKKYYSLQTEQGSLQEAQSKLVEEVKNYQTSGFRQILAKEAEQWNINYDEVKAYAAAIRNADDELWALTANTEDWIRESEEYALAQLKIKKALEQLQTATSKYSTALKAFAKNEKLMQDPEVAQGLLAYQQALQKLFGGKPEDYTAEFIKNNLDTIEQAAKGDESAFRQLGQARAEALVDGLTDKVTGEKLTEQIKDLIALDDVEVGVTLSLDEAAGNAFLAKLQSWADNNSIDGSQMLDLAAAGGWEPVTQTMSFGDASDSEFARSGKVTYIAADGTLTTQTVNDYVSGGGSSENQVEVLTGWKKTGTSDKGGGGGGGGGKKEPHKIKRYRNITNQIQNNDRQVKSAQRKKDRAVGTTRLDFLKEEQKLQEENLKLQQQYQKEIEDWLATDTEDMLKAFKKINFTPIFDETGEVINNDEFEKAFEAIGDGSNKAWKKAEEALAQYEETLDLLNDKIEEIAELQETIFDTFLEEITIKIEEALDVSTDRFEYLDYLLDKIDDDAYQTAEAIALVGEKTAETMKKIHDYTQGLEDILALHGFSLADLDNLTVEDLRNANFTQNEIDQIREWRSELLTANKDLLEMRKTIIEKVVSALDDLNEKVQNSYDKFDKYNSVLDTYKNITDLMGRNISAQSRQIMNRLNDAMLRNAQNTAQAARKIYEDAQIEAAQAQAAYQLAVASGDQEAIRRWQEVIDKTSEALQEAEEQWLDSWQSALDQAKTIFEELMEQLQEDYSRTMGGTFGALDYLQEAYDRQKELGQMYERDFDRLYDLSKLARDISNAIDDTDSIPAKRRLRDLQAEINKLQADGTKLSEYDVEVLRKRFELEQARLALDDAQNAKSRVRLQRDSNGNWGYVYTADEDEVAKAEQEYEDKLHEYQVLNADYLEQLQDEALNVQQTWQETVGQIKSDLGLGVITQEEAEARLEEINAWLAEQQAYFVEQTNHALDNQASLYDRTLTTYNVAEAIIVDTWEETNLALMSKIDDLDRYMQNWNKAVQEYLANTEEALTAYQNNIDNINTSAGITTTNFENHIDSVIVDINDLSDDTLNTVNELSDTMKNEFANALMEAVNWELKYVEAMDAMINRNEEFVKSLNLMIEKLAGVDTSVTQMLNPLETFENTVTQSTTPVYLSATSDLLSNYVSEYIKLLNANIAAYGTGLGSLDMPGINGISSLIDQNVSITAEFPNATNHSEIEEAFNNLINKASQYANRKGY